MTDTRPVVLMLACQKYIVYLRAAISRISRSSIRVVGVIGDASQNETQWNEQDSILTVPVSDMYEDLPKKVWAAIEWIYSKWPNTIGIWKTDDDIVYNSVDYLISELYKNASIPYWGLVYEHCAAGIIHEWRVQSRFHDKTQLSRVHQSAQYCWGHGYWINPTAIRLILNNKEEYDTSTAEDICTGFVLNKYLIIPQCICIQYTEKIRTKELLEIV
jgi:hypothetical protein